MSLNHSLTDLDLRVLAEAAVGRGGPLYAVRIDGKLSLEEAADGLEVLFEVSSPPDIDGRDQPASIEIETTKGTQQVLETFDALFWSEAAFKKFIFTYYLSLRLLDKEGRKKLQAAYDDKKVVAFGHTPKSEIIPDFSSEQEGSGDSLLSDLYAFKTDLTSNDGSNGVWIRVSEFTV